MSDNKKKTVTQYRQKCIGCGSCSLFCPEYWEISEEDGKANLKESTTKGKDVHQRKLDIEHTEDNKLAAENCPVNIIKIN